MKEKIFVTGGSGMLGRNVIKKLREVGYNNIIDVNRKKLDIMNREDVMNFFKENNPTIVIHLASSVGGIKEKIENPVKYMRDNILINVNIIDACAEFNIKKLINISSSCIYPIDCSQPSSEKCFRYGKLEPANEGYALSKILGVKLCEYYNRQKNLNFITLVAPNLFGEFDHFNEKGHVVPSMIYKTHKAKCDRKNCLNVWGTGEAKREFLFAEDLSNIIIFSIKNINKEHMINGILNCGLNGEVSIKDLCILIKKIVNFNGELIFDKTKPEGVMRRALDSSEFLKIVSGEMHFTNFEEGIKKSYKYFLKHEEEQK